MNKQYPMLIADMPGMLLVAFLAAFSGCSPHIDRLDPPSGPPGTVVEIVGTDLRAAEVVWDAGQPVPTSRSGQFFTVPPAAPPGIYDVQLARNNDRSNTVAFEVTDEPVRPRPRLDDITLYGFTIANGVARTALMAHGANIDVGARLAIRVIGSGQPATDEQALFHRLLRNGTLNVSDVSTLAYPIRHYATIFSRVEEAPGSTLRVAVINLDGQVSDSLTYRLPSTLGSLDSDGDGLFDNWELHGYDADQDGNIDVDLPAWGATPYRKDLFIEVDMMAGVSHPWRNSRFQESGWQDIVNTFANAPVLNSDGSPGITAHIDVGQMSRRSPHVTWDGGEYISPFAECIVFSNSIYAPPDIHPRCDNTTVVFETIKQDPNFFDPARKAVFRYGILAFKSGHDPGESGRAETSTNRPPGSPNRLRDRLSNDFYISLGSWSDGERRDFFVGTVLHELGHTFALEHGGDEVTNSKDNYNSVMQYGDMRGGPSNKGWICRPRTRSPFPPLDRYCQRTKTSPSQYSGIDTDCDLTNENSVFTYSQGMRAPLDEGSLDEKVGVCDNIAVNWTCKVSTCWPSCQGGRPSASCYDPISNNVQVDLDGRGASTDTHHDFADWANIELNFRLGQGWNQN